MSLSRRIAAEVAAPVRFRLMAEICQSAGIGFAGSAQFWILVTRIGEKRTRNISGYTSR